MRQSNGLTLIEVLVTTALLGMVLGLIAQFFMVQTRAAQLQKATNEVSESARIALSLLTWDLQNAGYLVTTSSSNLAISATPGGSADALTTRYFNRDLSRAQKVSYSVQEGSLLRAQYNDVVGTEAPDQVPTVASVTALNILYETRKNQFALPTTASGSPGCVAGQTPVTDDAGTVVNCKVNWAWSDTPERLVRQVKVQVLARSSFRIAGHQSATASYTFASANGTDIVYSTEPGYVYQFAEQTVVAANLGR